MSRRNDFLSWLNFINILVVFSFLLAACSSPASISGNPQPSSTAAPTNSIETSLPEQTPKDESVSIDLNGVAQSYTSQVIAAVSPDADAPYWEVMPQYEVLTLSGYPVSSHLMTPQIYIYPVADLARTNEAAGKIAADLQTLLEKRLADTTLPFLPLLNASQVMHAQVSYLDFKNGSGVRFVTQFDQAPLPINNHELIYTFQGLTRDGQFYIAAVFPLNLASLPVDEKISGQEPAEFINDFPKYLQNVVGTLDQQQASNFTPDLSALDALIQSIEIH